MTRSLTPAEFSQLYKDVLFDTYVAGMQKFSPEDSEIQAAKESQARLDSVLTQPNDVHEEQVEFFRELHRRLTPVFQDMGGIEGDTRRKYQFRTDLILLGMITDKRQSYWERRGREIHLVNLVVDAKGDYNFELVKLIPWWYSPAGGVLDVSPEIRQAYNLPLENLEPTQVVQKPRVQCLLTRQEILRSRATPTFDGNYVSSELVLADYGYTRLGSGKVCPTSETIQVMSPDRTTPYKEHKSRVQPNWVERAGIWYTYNPDSMVRVFNSGVREKTPEMKPLGSTGQYLNPNAYRILDYDTDVLNFFHFKVLPGEDKVTDSSVAASNTLFMGVELEVEMSHSATMTKEQAAGHTMLMMKGDAIVKRDGSLDNGFEITTVPASLGYHYTIWEDLCCSPLRKELVSYLRSTCGLHVHVSKNCFTDLTLGMFCTFINSTENRDFINKISRRKPNDYCERTPTKVKYGRYRDGLLTEHGGSQEDKYVATNLYHEDTVEIRMFKGTLAYSGIMKCLEFCHALHRFVTFHTSYTKLSHVDFLKWAADKKTAFRTTYPYLFMALCTDGYLTENPGNGKVVIRKPGEVPDEHTGDDVKDSSTRVTPVTKLELVRKASVLHKTTKIN